MFFHMLKGAISAKSLKIFCARALCSFFFFILCKVFLKFRDYKGGCFRFLLLPSLNAFLPLSIGGPKVPTLRRESLHQDELHHFVP